MTSAIKAMTHAQPPGLRRDASSLTIPHLASFRFMEVTENGEYTITDSGNTTKKKYMYKGLEYDAHGIRGVQTSAGATLAAGIVYLVV